MQVNIIIFGPLKDITGTGNITLYDVADSDQLIQQLHIRYPALSEFSYLVAVEKEVITSNKILADNYTVALLPPYSGG